MAKGGAFEREVAKKLSLWLSYGKRDDLICRTDSSGGRATVRDKKGLKTNKYLYGDLKHSDDAAKSLFDLWSIECKTGYGKKSTLKNGTNRIINWDVLDLIDSQQGRPMIAKMWSQCVNSAGLSSRQPILIFRRNQRKICVAICLHYYLVLGKYFGELKTRMIEIEVENEYVPYDKLVVMSLDSFLKWINPKSLLDLSIK